MDRHLSPDIHLAKIGPDVVVLDARADSYFCLPGAATAIGVGTSGLCFEDPDLAEAFEAAGFLGDTPSPPSEPFSPRPTRDLGLVVAERVAPGDLLLILTAWLSMAASYHAGGFASLVAAARRGRKARAITAPSEGVIELVAAFERILPWLPFQGVCLYRAFLLLRVLRWRGHDARWVFGVHTWPFQAHCWLQIGDVVLDDSADRLAGFTTILEI